VIKIFAGKRLLALPSFHRYVDQTITVNGIFPKANAWTGWRVGYICALYSFAKAVEKMQGQLPPEALVSHSVPLAGYRSDPRLAFQRNGGWLYLRRETLVLDLFTGYSRNQTHVPEGGFYFSQIVTAFFGKSAQWTHCKRCGIDFAYYLLV